MDLGRKLAILAGAARYDVSCAASGSRRPPLPGGRGATLPAGLCHSWADDGRCVSLLKILFTNHCVYDCAYCANRSSNPVPRAAFTVAEVVDLTLHFHRRNYIEGLFLSSGVMRNPDYTMERLVRVAAALRRRGFRGYIHLKVIPGAGPELVRRAGLLADRVSVNIELPTAASLRLLAPDKPKEAILGPMGGIAASWRESREERRATARAPLFAPAGQSTQLIVGASPETDQRILILAESLYRRYQLKRVYYSAFTPVAEDRRLPAVAGPDLLREHRLYQADWLVRRYGFAAAELVDPARPHLDRALDPKTAWALGHLDLFPVDAGRADQEALLRTPGVGPVAARRIVESRLHAPLGWEELRRLGVVVRRARFFLTCGGRAGARGNMTPERIRRELAPPPFQPPLFA